MINTQTQIDSLIDLAVIQRTELKQLIESLPQLRDHLSSEIERNLEEIEPAIRSELEQFVAARALDTQAKTSAELSAKLDAMARNLESTTAAKYSVLMAERAENANLLAKAEARIEDAASMLSHAVKEIVTDELSRFPRAGEIDQLRKEFAEPRGLNPRGRWQVGETYNKLDLVSYNGDSYVSNTDGNSEKPSRSSAAWTLSAARGNGGAGGGVTSMTDLVPVPANGEILIGNGSAFVNATLTAGTGISISNGPGSITISATDGNITLDDGTAAAPSLNFTNEPTTGLFRASANVMGFAVAGVSRATMTTSGVTVTGTITPSGSLHAAAGSVGNPSIAFNADQNTGLYNIGADNIGAAIGGVKVLDVASTGLTVTGALGATSLTAPASTALTLAGGSTSGQILFNSPSATERARLTSTGNLLIGGTTDITGSGGLKVFGTTAASSTTSGALQVGSNVGLSGNAGGASYFGGNVTVGTGAAAVALVLNRGTTAQSSLAQWQTASSANWSVGSGATGTNTNLEFYNHNTASSNLTLNYTTGAATFAGAVNISASGQANAKATITNTDTASYAHLDLSSSSAQNSSLYQFGSTYTTSGRYIQGSTMLEAGGAGGLNFATSAATPIRFYTNGDNVRLTIDSAGAATFAGAVSVASTTSASSSTVGALTIGNGTAATNVAIGGGVLAVGGYASVGGSPGSFSALRILGANTTGTTQAGVDQQVVFQSGATTAGRGVSSSFATAAAAFTMIDGAAFYASSPSLGATSAVTNNRGLHILNQGATGITNAYGIDIAAQSGAATTNIGLRNAGLTSLTNTTASTGVGTGALQIAGGIYAGAASVFGSTVSTAGRLQVGSALTSYIAEVREDAASVTGLRTKNDSTSASAYSQLAINAFGNSWGFRMGSSAANSNALEFISDITAPAVRFSMTPAGAATFAGAVTIAGTVIHTLSATPASATAAGTVGTMSWDTNYIYICTATNTWKRVAIATW
jgi:hypothetical protein